MDVRIRELDLPGIGRRYDLALREDLRLTVIVGRDGTRQVAIARDTRDEPDAIVTLTHDEAVAAAALLTGARFSIEDDATAAGAGERVAVETVTIDERSPAVGRSVRDVPLPSDSDAAILAVIRDDTAELVEDDGDQPCRPGDRLVVAARKERLAEVTAQLLGRS